MNNPSNRPVSRARAQDYAASRGLDPASGRTAANADARASFAPVRGHAGPDALAPEDEAHYRAVLEERGIGIAMLNRSTGRLLRPNAALCAMLGYSEAEMLTLTIADVRVLPKATTALDSFESMDEGARAQEGEGQFLRKDGSLFWGRLVLTATPAKAGQASPVIATLEDVSALRGAQDLAKRLAERLAATMESITDGFFTLDRDWRFAYVNAEAERLLARPRAELAGKLFWEECRKRPDDPSNDVYRDAMRTMRTAHLEEFYAPLDRWFDVRAYPSEEGLAIHLRDISDKKRLEEQLKALCGRLLVVQEFERAALARELHDEFGQVLTTMMLQLQLLARQTPSPRLEDCTALIDDALRRVRSLCLDLSPSQLPLEGLAITLRSHLARLSHQTSRTIRFSAGLDVPVLTGQRALACFRIVQEAVTNALRHSGATHIEVDLTRTSEWIHLAIRDDGAGFDLAGIRAHGPNAKGMGLRGMEDRVSILGGALEIHTTPGAGTRIGASLLLASLQKGVP